MDNFIPVLGAKKFGGGRGSVIGSSVGLVIGLLFLGPFGILLGPFFGALIGELLVNFENKKGCCQSSFWRFNRIFYRCIFEINYRPGIRSYLFPDLVEIQGDLVVKDKVTPFTKNLIKPQHYIYLMNVVYASHIILML